MVARTDTWQNPKHKTSNRKTPLDLTTPWQLHHQGGPADKIILGGTAKDTVTSVSELLNSPLFDTVNDWWKKYTADGKLIAAPGAARDVMHSHKAPWNRKSQARSLVKAQVKTSPVKLENLPPQQPRASHITVAASGKALPVLPRVNIAASWEKETAKAIGQRDLASPWHDKKELHDQTAPWRIKKARLEVLQPPPKPVKFKTPAPPSAPVGARKVCRTVNMDHVHGKVKNV